MRWNFLLFLLRRSGMAALNHSKKSPDCKHPQLELLLMNRLISFYNFM